MPSMNGRVCLITGANTGIGRVTAIELARAGATVVVTCRSLDKAAPVLDEIRAIQDAAGGEATAHALALDLGSLDNVRACADAFHGLDLPLHVLINNAGLGAIRGQTDDGFEMAFGVNHLGHYLLTRLLLDRLRASAPARIINVASAAHYRGKLDLDRVREPTPSFKGVPEYSNSKLANVLFTAALQRRLEGTGVVSASLHPGVVATDVWRHGPGFLMAIFKWFMISSEDGAKTTLHCAMDPSIAEDPALYYDRCKPKQASARARDAALAEALWQKSAEWVGLDAR